MKRRGSVRGRADAGTGSGPGVEQVITQSQDELQQVTRWVLDILRCHKLYLKVEKCGFECKQIEYLGLITSHNRVTMDPVKVSAVVKWPQPCNRKEVQSFLRFTNFYCHFIESFSSVTHPLFDLTKKDALHLDG